MTAKYRTLLTEQGKALLANATATGQKLEITHMAVGDGGGSATNPLETQTKLVNEKRRAVLNSLQVNASNNNQVTAEQVIPEDVGGWWIRELGLYDKNGVLVAIANTPDTYKPLLTEGAGRTQVVRMVLLVKGDANATIVADKTSLLVSRDTLNAAIAEHARSRNHPDATLQAKGFTQLSNDSNSNSETLAATPKAVKAVNDASLKIAANLKDLPNKAAARGNLELGTAATRNVGEQKNNLMEVGAFGLGAGPVHREDALSNRGEIYRVNGTSKNAPGGGVYGVLNLPCDGGPSSGYLAIQTNGASYVGTSTIADKPLNWYRLYTTGFKPTAADVGAYSKEEAEGRFVKQSGDIMSGPLALPRVVFPNENTANADTDVNRENGFTVESLVATTNKGYPVPGGMGVLFTGKVNEFRNVQFAVGSGDLAFYLRSLRKDSPASTRWAQVYTTDYKPKAADVGAFSKEEAEGKFVKQSGDIITGGLTVNGSIETKSGLTAPYATITGSLTTKGGVELFGASPYIDFHHGNTNADYDVRIINEAEGRLAISAKTLRTNENFSVGFDAHIDRNLYVNNECRVGAHIYAGDAAYQTNGDINGSMWGGYLSNYLNHNFVRDIRLGNVESAGSWKGPGYYDAPGYVLTGAHNYNTDEYIDHIFRRPLQKHIGGNWVTVWSV